MGLFWALIPLLLGALAITTTKSDKCNLRGRSYENGKSKWLSCSLIRCNNTKWKPENKMSKNCKHCAVFNDPHLKSFDNYAFDFHGTCTYALTQKGLTQNPEYGIFEEFRRCYANSLPSCVNKTFFKTNSTLEITTGKRGLTVPEIYDLFYKGGYFTVPDDDYVHELPGTGGDVMTWRQNNCVRISSRLGLMIQKCQHRIDIWANKKLWSGLYGLCGNPNNNSNNDFTDRNNKILSLADGANDFGESWKTQNHCNAGKRKRSITEEIGEVMNKCKKSPAEWNRIMAKCNRNVGGTASHGHAASLELFQRLRDACTFDLCMMKNGADNPEKEMSEWLGAVQEMTEEGVEIEVEECDPAKGECDDSIE